jgi:hypothetical protein
MKLRLFTVGASSPVLSSLVRKIMLLEDPVESLIDEVRKLPASQVELDRRLIRLQGRFELLERMAAPSSGALPEKSET